MDPLKDLLAISAEVSRALSSGQPVVAMESTDLSYGMPHPQNVEMLLGACGILRQNGAVPAVIAIVEGRLKVGLSEDEITALAAQGRTLAKASRRDVPVLAARGMSAVTTVAASMVLATLAGIKVFAAAGFGGVQRDGSFDISADLEELSRTGCLVVTSGVKSVLDIGATLEYLETKGVPVLGYQTEDFPAFYSCTSGFGVHYTISTPAEAAKIFAVKEKLGFCSGVLVANPVPKQHELKQDVVDAAICAALEEARQSGICGKQLTAFLNDRVEQMTGGKTVAAKTQLMYENARLAANIAREL